MKMNKCSCCGKQLPDKLLFSYVDESNIAITKNSKDYCWRCYNQKYPHDKIGLDTILKQLGYRVNIDIENKTMKINDKQYEIQPNLSEELIKEYNL